MTNLYIYDPNEKPVDKVLIKVPPELCPRIDPFFVSHQLKVPGQLLVVSLQQLLQAGIPELGGAALPDEAGDVVRGPGHERELEVNEAEVDGGLEKKF